MHTNLTLQIRCEILCPALIDELRIAWHLPEDPLRSPKGVFQTGDPGEVPTTGACGTFRCFGASGRNVLGMVLRQSITVVLIGAMAGLALTIASTRLVAGFLYGLSPTDFTTIAVATLILIMVSLIAGYVPARRATKVTALRYE